MNILIILPEILIFLSLLLCQPVASTTNESSPIEPTVNTDWATIKGIRQNVLGRDIDAFLGIPFAKPPIGELRFRRPVKPEKYQNEVYSAQTFGPACAQVHNDRHNLSVISEDCLYLNIWRPVSENSIQRLKPVFFYVYGSGFGDGSATEDTRQGDILSSISDLIVVSVNYRLAFFGYGYGGSEEMPGNMGNYDVVMALQWVNDNIESFLGDPTRVTLAGDCAGAMIASSILISPMVPQKLYDNLYLMSGIPNPNTAIEDKDFALKKSKLLAKAVGCLGDDSSTSNDTEPMSDETINCLRSLNYSVINEAEITPELESLLIWNPYPPFQPIWGTDFLPYSPDVLVDRGEPRRKIHILMGNEQNEDEQSHDFVPIDKAQAYQFLYNYTLRQRIEPMTDDDFDLLFRYYFGSIDDNDVFNLKGAISSFIGDYFHHCPILLFAEKWVQLGQVIHDYMNEYLMDGYSRKERPYGTYHGDDTFQILGKAFRDYDKFSNRDRQMTRNMISFVADFVEGKKLHWPPILTRKDGHVLPLVWIINEKMDPRLVRVDPMSEICHFWGKMAGLKLSF